MTDFPKPPALRSPEQLTMAKALDDLAEIKRRSAELPPIERAMRPGAVVVLLDILHAAHAGKMSLDDAAEFISKLIADEITALFKEWPTPETKH